MPDHNSGTPGLSASTPAASPPSSPPEHKTAGLFPAMTPAEYRDLCNDIKVNGLRAPILLWHGQLIDGRHRLRACHEVGVQPRFEEVDCQEEGLERFVWSMNAARRSLTTSQRAMVAARMSQGSVVGRPSAAQILSKGRISQPDAAKLASVSLTQVTRAADVQKKSPALAEDVHAGKLTVTSAVRRIKAGVAPPQEKPKEPQGRVYAEMVDRAFEATWRLEPMLTKVVNAQARIRPDKGTRGAERRLLKSLHAICEMARELEEGMSNLPSSGDSGEGGAVRIH
jgi:ParB-like nuclease domain